MGLTLTLRDTGGPIQIYRSGVGLVAQLRLEPRDGGRPRAALTGEGHRVQSAVLNTGPFVAPAGRSVWLRARIGSELEDPLEIISHGPNGAGSVRFEFIGSPAWFIVRDNLSPAAFQHLTATHGFQGANPS